MVADKNSNLGCLFLMVTVLKEWKLPLLNLVHLLMKRVLLDLVITLWELLAQTVNLKGFPMMKLFI